MLHSWPLLDLSSHFMIKTQILDHFPLVSAHSSAPPHLFDSPNNKQWRNNLFWGTTCDAALSVCRQDVIFCRRMKCGQPSHSALHRFLSSCSQKTGREHDSTQSQVFFFSFSIAVSFPPLCLPHSNFTVVVPPLSFSFSLSICLPGADDQLS